MSLRERREPLDAVEVLLRQTLHERAGSRMPAPDVRSTLLKRAARQQRRLGWRLGWRLPLSLPGLFTNDLSRAALQSPHHQLLYVENLFGPRLGWFSFNQLMR